MPRKKTEPSFDEIMNSIPNLSNREVQQIITRLSSRTLTSAQQKNLTKLINNNLDAHAQEIGLGKACPNCGSYIIIKHGKRENGAQRLKCQDCGHRFSYYTNTLLENTKYPWDCWVEFIHLILLYTPIKKIQKILIDDYHCVGITEKTIFNWRMKVLEIAKQLKQPTLTGIVEVDETSFHEGQKGSKSLIDPIDTNNNRKPRKTRKASKYGALGPEFGTVICAVDHAGHIVSKYVGVGAATTNAFEDEIVTHFKNVTHLCSDANNIYSKYCKYKNIIHYIRPSNYLVNKVNGLKSGKTEEEMFKQQELDYIVAPGQLGSKYKEFTDMKDKYELSLARVNQFHSRLKVNLITRTHGISLKNIEGYVCWETFLANYANEHGHIPSSRKDAEEILKILLSLQKNVYINDVMSRKVDFSSINEHYKRNLIKKTDEARKKRLKPREYITSEEFGDNFNKREFLENLPIYMLRYLCDYCQIKGRSKLSKNHTYRFKRWLEIHPDIDEAIQSLIEKFGVKNES